MKLLGTSRDKDEEMVAITENDACGVDAVQFILGCTFGKGNLHFRDYGKQAHRFSAFGQQGWPAGSEKHRQGVDTGRVCEVCWKNPMHRSSVQEPEPIPERAVIRKSGFCSICGERVMESRLRPRQVDAWHVYPVMFGQRRKEGLIENNRGSRKMKEKGIFRRDLAGLVGW